MTDAVAAPTATPSRPIPWTLFVGLAIAATIAGQVPFDRIFAAATFGVPVLRSAAILALGLIGAAVGGRIGLHVEPRDRKGALLVPLAAATVIGVWCAVIDTAMRGQFIPGYLDLVTTTPLATRIPAFMMRAFNENILYRLFLTSVLAWGLGRFWKAPDGRPASGAFWTAIVMAQAINIGANVTVRFGVTPLGLVYDVLRYMIPGVTWGWLYWKRDFQGNEIASTTVHIVLQPLVTLSLSLV